MEGVEAIIIAKEIIQEKEKAKITDDAAVKEVEITKGQESSEEEVDEDGSPRGVLEIPVSGAYSDSSSGSSSEIEKSVGVAWEQSYGTLHWKKLFGQIKKKSPMKFSTIPLLGGYGYDLSKKAFKKRLGRNHSAGEAISSSCGDDIAMPKPTWRNFTYEQLKLATDNFSPDKLIGKGGHAEVYQGLLPDGQIVAVKKILNVQKNNEDRVGDFLSELGIIAHIDHPNTAKLIGFSADGGLHLVLQFSPHGSLSTVLHGDSAEVMDWERRYKVIKGIAEGLLYLHCDCQRRIIHRDITASNILLSENYEAQISDFGLAKWLPENWLHHVVSPIEGTFGYMAPEYFMHGIVHEKTDVFAFGVLLLEIITGRRAVDTSSRQSLVMWVRFRSTPPFHYFILNKQNICILSYDFEFVLLLLLLTGKAISLGVSNDDNSSNRTHRNRRRPQPRKPGTPPPPEMDKDAVIQLCILIFSLAIFYVLHSLPKRAFSKLRSRARPNSQAHRHFIQGAQLLARARSTKTKATSFNLAKSAVDEADKALALEPRDPAAHILKAMAETLMGHKLTALKSLDLALSPPAVKMLSEVERGDALIRRADLLIGLNRKRRVDSAIGDLKEAIGLSPENSRAFCLLGHCYEVKEMRVEARNAFEKSLALEPGLKEAREGLERLGS